MTSRFKRVSSITTALLGTVCAAWSPSSHACSGDSPVMASVCIMATPATFGPFNRTYQLAAGQQLSLNQYTALFALIGVTYGGNGQTTFNLPDLRGKVIVGANTDTYPAGKTGGQETVTLSIAQLPPHNFVVTNAPVDVSKITATTTLTGFSGSANLSGVTITGPATGLTLKGATTSGGQTSPSGNSLGKANSAAGAIYSTSAPDGALNAGSISGNLSLTVGTGVTAPVVLSGSPTTTLGGTATATGPTNTLGAGAGVSVLSPYVALTYYIATNGIFPSRD
jgi:microcystin-dependent protein